MGHVWERLRREAATPPAGRDELWEEKNERRRMWKVRPEEREKRDLCSIATLRYVCVMYIYREEQMTGSGIRTHTICPTCTNDVGSLSLRGGGYRVRR